jgi:hypothetical protein
MFMTSEPVRLGAEHVGQLGRPGTLQIELDPAEGVLVGVRPEPAPETLQNKLQIGLAFGAGAANAAPCHSFSSGWWLSVRWHRLELRVRTQRSSIVRGSTGPWTAGPSRSTSSGSSFMRTSPPGPSTRLGGLQPASVGCNPVHFVHGSVLRVEVERLPKPAGRTKKTRQRRGTSRRWDGIRRPCRPIRPTVPQLR